MGRSGSRRARRRHDRHGERQDARLQPPGARRGRSRSEGTRALPLSHQGARTGPGAQPHGARRARVRPAIYDGDTPIDQRRQVRTWANAILSNPDMLHLGVLPHHDRWGDVLANLEYVIVDEAHVYRGVFGSHVGQRPAAAAAAGGRLRGRAAVPARVGDDRESGRARHVVDGAGDDGRLRRFGAAGRADDRPLEPAGDGRGAQPPRERARRGVAAARGARRTRPAGRCASRRAASPPSSSTDSLSTGLDASTPTGSRRIAPGTRPRSGATSSGGSSPASCSAFRRRTRSSSASTSACSTA